MRVPHFPAVMISGLLRTSCRCVWRSSSGISLWVKTTMCLVAFGKSLALASLLFYVVFCCPSQFRQLEQLQQQGNGLSPGTGVSLTNHLPVSCGFQQRYSASAVSCLLLETVFL